MPSGTSFMEALWLKLLVKRIETGGIWMAGLVFVVVMQRVAGLCRYLVFYDDGFAQYMTNEELHEVIMPSEMMECGVCHS